MARFLDARLYLVTSQEVSAGRSTLDILRLALAAGVRLIQLREKSLGAEEFLALAADARRITSDSQSLLIINDNVDVALAVGADGVHLGRNDESVADARRRAGDLIIGASCHSIEDAQEAEVSGASYINIGPLFATGTKAWDGEFLGMDSIGLISGAVSIPYTVMGGIKKEHMSELVARGARTIAVVTAITAADDPEAAARELLSEISAAEAGGGSG